MFQRMASRRRLGAIGLILALAGVPLSFAGGQPEQNRGYAPGMMGGGQRGGYGHGMMGGGAGAYGPGMMGGGMMGGFEGLDNSLQRTVDIKKAQSLVTEYLAGVSNKKLEIDEIMEFENNLYVLIK